MFKMIFKNHYLFPNIRNALKISLKIPGATILENEDSLNGY